MAQKSIIKSNCIMCHGGCGILFTIEDGKVTQVKGDPEHPRSKGFICKRGQASVEFVYHPDRINHPLKRVGVRGEGKWQKIGWDEAFNITAKELNRVKEKYGAEKVLMVHGSAKGLQDTYLVRLANAFGTPNVVCSDHVCHVPRMLACEYTFGFMPRPEYNHPPALIVSWGANSAATHIPIYQAQLQAIKKGAKMLVINPMKIPLANNAQMWLRIKPGSDLALALGILNVVINEKLYDEDFVNKWTTGFDKLRQHVKKYSPDKVAEMTWISSGDIHDAAIMYATNKPSFIDFGNGLDQTINSFQTARAISILMAIIGNLDVPGGELETEDSGFRFNDRRLVNEAHGRWSYELELRNNIPREKRKSKVGGELNMLEDFRYTIPQAVIKSILEGQPYRLHAAYIQGSNPLSCWCNIKDVYKAFNKLEFIAVSDMFMTPTAALADIIFPVASYYEYDSVQIIPDGTMGEFQGGIAHVGERKSDFEIVNGMANRLELSRYFWDKLEDFWDYVLKPTGYTFAQVKQMGRFNTVKEKARQYRKYEKTGFRTPSGKVELYSEQLKQWGFDPLPVYYESPHSILDKSALAEEYPLLGTSRKPEFYVHSDGRQLKTIRSGYPDPIVVINMLTAGDYGIKEGDWVYIETIKGRIKQKARLSDDIDRRVVVVDHAWWYPEKGEKELFGWADSNCNVLTSDSPPFNKELGSFTVRGFACKIYKVV